MSRGLMEFRSLTRGASNSDSAEAIKGILDQLSRRIVTIDANGAKFLRGFGCSAVAPSEANEYADSYQQ